MPISVSLRTVGAEKMLSSEVLLVVVLLGTSVVTVEVSAWIDWRGVMAVVNVVPGGADRIRESC